MASAEDVLHHRKRRRRRRVDKPPISAHLVLDERMKDDVGILSEDLFADFFPGANRAEPVEDSPRPRSLHHVAISPWLPTSLSTPQKVSWTILPVRLRVPTDPVNRLHSSLQFPARSHGLQTFIHNLRLVSPSKVVQRQDAPVEIRIMDVVPLQLDSVFVTVDTEALRQLHEVQERFGGGFGSKALIRGAAPKRRASGTDGTNGGRSEDVKSSGMRDGWWKEAVRLAVKTASIIHTGDSLSLPLPSHPVTHIPPPPAKVTFCDPVSQGTVSPTTRIVVVKSRNQIKSTRTSLLPTVVNGVHEEDDDTSNEQFFSASETGVSPRKAVTRGPPPRDLDSDFETSATETSDLSDDSEDMISLNTPALPTQSSGALSSYNAATPRPSNMHRDGVATPGSVYSTFTATTIRGNTTKGKVYKAQPLLKRISDDLLHPRPSSSDDDEARVYVDTTTLVKVGCFSGDWVKVEPCSESQGHELSSWGLGDFQSVDAGSLLSRAAKIYGLPPHMSKKPYRYSVRKGHNHSSSIFGLPAIQSDTLAYLSPLLFANLHEPSYLNISPLPASPSSNAPSSSIENRRFSSTSSPPHAKEVTLLKLSTPLSTDRLLQPSLFAGLKTHFEQKRRLVKSGDLIGIPIDENLGKAVFDSLTAEEDSSAQGLLSRGSTDVSVGGRPVNYTGVAWFKVGDIVVTTTDGALKDDSVWDGVVCVDSANTKMVQNGSVQGKLPSITTNPWQYYLGMKKVPQPAGLGSSWAELPRMPTSQITATRRRLRELISASTSEQAIRLGLPPLAVLLTSTHRLIGKATVAARACEDLGLHSFIIDSFDLLTEGGAGGGDVKTEALLKARAERAFSCGANFTVLVIKHVEVLDAERMAKALEDIQAESRVIIATTTAVEKVSEGIRKLFTHELDVGAPDEKEREGILRDVVADAGIGLAPDVDLSGVAVKTAALVAGDLVDVVERAVVAKRARLESLAANAALSQSLDMPVTVRDVEVSGGAASLGLTNSDFTIAVTAARKNFADAIGAPKIPNVSWSDVGGLSQVKSAVMETIQLPLARPELFAKGMKKRSGILFYGPPGTGKTLLAKAIATEFSLNFFSVKGPELLNMYIGESEANVRRVFQRARDARPCVVFFDELDSVAPKRGNQGDSGGVMDRIVSQLLAELDGMSEGTGNAGEGGVFVIGATNRPDLLDQALLRPGRFDKMLYLGVADTHDKQLTILEALTRKFTLSPSLSLSRLSSTLPFTYTGADLYALCSDAMLKAITRKSSLVDTKVRELNAARTASGESEMSVAYFFDHFATPADIEVTVTEEDFVAAKKELIPSVSLQELSHYERVRKEFEGTGGGDSGNRREGGSLNGQGKAVAKNQLPRTFYNGNTGNAHGHRNNEDAEDDLASTNGGDESDDEDDHIVRTSHPQLDNSSTRSNDPKPHARPPVSNGRVKVGSVASYKGKGKGKAAVRDDGGLSNGAFGDEAEADDELYT